MNFIESFFNTVNSMFTSFFGMFQSKQQETVQETAVEDTSIDSTDIDEEISSE